MRHITGNIRGKTIRGSLTVEAAIVIPIVLFCILWIIEKGIVLYTETTALVQEQQMWEEFYPAGTFRKTQWLEGIWDR